MPRIAPINACAGREPHGARGVKVAVPKPKFKQTRDTREAVLSAAAKNFREKGYAAVTLREIAKTAGLTTGSLYYHFKSKEDVVREVLDQGHIFIRLAVEKALADPRVGTDDRSRIRCAIKTHMACLFGDDSLSAANIRIFSQVPAQVKYPTLASRHAYEALWRSLFQDAKASGFLDPNLDIEVMIPLMLGAVNWTLEWSGSDDVSVDAIVDHVVTMLEA